MRQEFEKRVREILAGCQRITPQELWLHVHGAHVPCEGAHLAAAEDVLAALGYVRVPVHRVRLSRDGYEWVREPWPSDDRWPDLSDDPVMIELFERYLMFQVASGAMEAKGE